MGCLESIAPARVFAYFEELSAIPRGSGNRKGIAEYCEAFAKRRGLRFVHDAAHNVVIYKDGTAGYETAAPLILQGHLDMVCQKEADCPIDFEKDGLSLYIDGDELRARGTTLGADNGIAVAMILAILESEDLPHPPLEAVFTADEEIGMLGAGELDKALLTGRRMINLDAEEDDTLTVSCAGGCDVVVMLNVTRTAVSGTPVTVTLSGLRGGHSGVEIHKNRTNADKLMGRLLQDTVWNSNAALIAVNGGDKPNAIPNACTATLCVADADAFMQAAAAWLEREKAALAAREPQFDYTLTAGDAGTLSPMSMRDTAHLLSLLNTTPDGVVEMSREIDGLVETSLNLGVLMTDGDTVTMHHALRSNKQAGLSLLEQALTNAVAGVADATQAFGHYPPWEFKADSPLQQLFIDCYTAQHGKMPKVEAIHAGLECAVFAAALNGLDCIAIGPALRDVHTTNEALSIRSTEQTYRLLLSMLEKCH